MTFDQRLLILLGIAAIFAGARFLWEGIRAIRKRYFKFRWGRSINDQVFRGTKARRIGFPVTMLGVLLLIGGYRLIVGYKVYTLMEFGIMAALISIGAAWMALEMTRVTH